MDDSKGNSRSNRLMELAEMIYKSSFAICLYLLGLKRHENSYTSRFYRHWLNPQLNLTGIYHNQEQKILTSYQFASFLLQLKDNNESNRNIEVIFYILLELIMIPIADKDEKLSIN